jgi:hypothetical protein
VNLKCSYASTTSRASKRNYARRNKSAFGAWGQIETSLKIENLRSNKITGQLTNIPTELPFIGPDHNIIRPTPYTILAMGLINHLYPLMSNSRNITAGSFALFWIRWGVYTLRLQYVHRSDNHNTGHKEQMNREH